MENSREQRICKTCNKPFSISEGEMKWIKEHNLAPFTHCKHCRMMRKKLKKQKEQKEAAKNAE